MLARLSKFPLRTDFVRFRAQSARCVTPHTLIYYQKSTHAPRLRVVVPKKVSKLATTRNHLKRLSYDTIWPEIKDKHLDCVVVYKPIPLKKSTAITQDLVHELSQATHNL